MLTLAVPFAVVLFANLGAERNDPRRFPPPNEVLRDHSEAGGESLGNVPPVKEILKRGAARSNEKKTQSKAVHIGETMSGVLLPSPLHIPDEPPILAVPKMWSTLSDGIAAHFVVSTLQATAPDFIRELHATDSAIPMALLIDNVTPVLTPYLLPFEAARPLIMVTNEKMPSNHFRASAERQTALLEPFTEEEPNAGMLDTRNDENLIQSMAAGSAQ